MRYEDLCKDAREYIDKYIRCKNKTREEALRENIIIEVIKGYEKGE